LLPGFVATALLGMDVLSIPRFYPIEFEPGKQVGLTLAAKLSEGVVLS